MKEMILLIYKYDIYRKVCWSNEDIRLIRGSIVSTISKDIFFTFN